MTSARSRGIAAPPLGQAEGLVASGPRSPGQRPTRMSGCSRGSHSGRTSHCRLALNDVPWWLRPGIGSHAHPALRDRAGRARPRAGGPLDSLVSAPARSLRGSSYALDPVRSTGTGIRASAFARVAAKALESISLLTSTLASHGGGFPFPPAREYRRRIRWRRGADPHAPTAMAGEEVSMLARGAKPGIPPISSIQQDLVALHRSRRSPPLGPPR